MGIDMTGLARKRTIRKSVSGTNPYVKLLAKLYKFLAVRTDSKFNKIVHARLLKSRANRAPISLSRVSTLLRRKSDFLNPAKGKAPIAVIVGDVLDDIRSIKVPALRVCALRFSRSARERITGAGGECLTFDQLAMAAPTGKNTFLLRGRKRGLEKYKYFGAAGTPGSHVKPYTSTRGSEKKHNKNTKTKKGFKHQ
jgi:large subunit ribosomal protein L18e